MQAASIAKKEALTRVDQVAKKITEEQKQQQQQVVSQIADVKQQTTTANAKIGEVSSEVTNVKSTVAATKTELDKTIADLKRTNGDLGVQSGLIATNSKELAALKRLGERNYFEFTIVRSKTPQRISDILIQVKKADTKRNRYTIDVIADDKKTENKDWTINEPVQFYTSKARQPYEIVVNQVQKDTIKGYLSTPKEQIAR
jgi:chromosome segregation ATPase